jgi:hypothetical protein
MDRWWVIGEEDSTHFFFSESWKGPLGFHSLIPSPLQIHLIEAACSFPWAASDCWGTRRGGDKPE